MGFNMGGGGSKGKKKVSAHDRALLDLKVQRDKLKQYQKKCDRVMARETELAKQLAAQGRKKAALICLKKRKLQQVMLDKSQAQLDNVSALIDSVEFAQMEVQVFDSLKQGNASLAALHEQIGGIEAVEELMMDVEENIEKQNEIDEALGQSIAAEGIDEDEILAELDALEAEASGIDALPDAPQHELPSTDKPQTEKQKAASSSKQKQAVLA